jgi:hypothetical protein
MAEPFVFETTYDPVAAQEEFMKAAKAEPTPRGDMVLIVAALLGFALLAWRYTFSLGAGIIATCTFGYAMKTRGREFTRRVAGFDRGPVHIRITNEGYAFSAPTFTSQGTWENVRGFNESHGYLRFHGWFMNQVFLRVEDLKAAGVYDQVKAMAEERRRAYGQTLTEASSGSRA